MIALLPGALVVFFSFQGGGFFPGPTALAAAGLLVLIALRVAAAEHPFAGAGRALLTGGALLGAFALWTLVSGAWSDAQGRALVEFDRALLYTLGFLAVGAVGYTPARMRWLVRGLTAGIFAVCVCALATRLAPDVWEVASRVSPARLSYPLTYFNALGLLAAIGVVLALALTSDRTEHRAVRVLGAAAIPVLASTTLLTFSRGAIAAGIIGVVVLLVAARPSALITGLGVSLASGAVAVVSAYDANLLGTDAPTTAAAAAQGHDVALVVGLCSLAAAAVRALLLRFDDPLARLRPPAALRRPPVVAALATGLAGIAVATAFATGLTGYVERQYDRFVDGGPVIYTEQRARLTDPGNNGRLDFWRAAVDAFEAEPLRGTGAGTYALEWERGRDYVYQVEDGHSLYLEVMGELGLVGLLLLAAAILLVLAGLLRRARGPNRVASGALFAAVVAWALHAGIDWDWEMPAITFWVFAAGGLGLAAAAGSARRREIPRTGRVVAALGCLLIAIVPARMLLADTSLRDSREAFAAGDCQKAIDRALDSIGVLSQLPDPYLILSYCDVRVGVAELGVRLAAKAVARDPRHWEPHYALALVQAAAGVDPRRAARRALALNPREPLARDAVKRFATRDSRTWRRRALSARLPVE